MQTWLDYLPRLWPGLINTLLITLTAFPLAVALAFLVGMLRVWKIPVLGGFLTAYVEFIRATPLVMQLFYVYFALPFIGITINPLGAAIFTFGIHYGAYLSETVRGAVLSIERTQWETATVLHFSRSQTARLIIIPQALRVALPIFTTELIDMFKTTSLAALVGIPELTFLARIEALRTFDVLIVFSLIAAIYFLVAFPATILARQIEKRVAIP